MDAPERRFAALDPDRFRILERIGAGRSLVFAAQDAELSRVVAVKVATDSAEHAGRYTLQREALLLGRIQHANVLSIHQAGWFDDCFALVLSYCPKSLEDVYPSSRPWRVLLDAVMQIGRGLAAIHAANILHRDIKPTNILVDADGQPLIADLGFACELDDVEALGEWVGTSQFMAPEVLEQTGCDVRSDLYAFCMTAFVLLYGHQPFATSERKLAGEISMSRRVDEMPTAVRDVLVRGLAVDPEARWSTMSELLAALREAADEHATSMRPVARSWRARAAIAAAGVSIMGLVGFLSITNARADVCDEATTELSETWGPDAREELWLMLGTRTVGNGLQEWVERWRAVRSQQCIEARQLGRATVASPCLASVADHFDATVRTLRSPAQRAGLDHAAMVRTLPDPEHCIAEPDDATHGVSGVGALVDAGVEVGTLVTIGDDERAWPALDAYAENARSINARYHEANALHWRGILLLREGELDEASVALGNAVADALEIDAHDVAIAAMLGALQVATAKGDVAAVETSAPMVRGYVERHDPKRLADLLRIEGTALVLGNVEERERGIDLLREAVRLEQRALDRRGSGSRERLSYALQALGQALMKIGEPDEAISILTESLRLHQGEFSSRSIRIGALREDIMLAMIADGRIADAMKLSVDLMAWRREQFGPRSIEDTEGMLKAVDALFEGGHSIEASMILGNLRSWLNDPRIEASYGDAIRQRIRQLDVDKDDSRGGE